MEELIELFSVLNQLEKGALGIFFELNYLVGVLLSIYITWFIVNFERPRMPQETNVKLDNFIAKMGISKDDLQKDYDTMYGWLYFHWIYFFISIVFALAVFFIFSTINSRLVVKEVKKPHGKVH